MLLEEIMSLMELKTMESESETIYTAKEIPELDFTIQQMAKITSSSEDIILLGARTTQLMGKKIFLKVEIIL